MLRPQHIEERKLDGWAPRCHEAYSRQPMLAAPAA
jgi:hypothetical protein